MKEFEIWREGFTTSDGSEGVVLLGTGFGNDFDEAVKDYIRKNPECGITCLNNERFKNIPRYYNSLKSNWSVYACCLFSSKEAAEGE